MTHPFWTNPLVYTFGPAAVTFLIATACARARFSAPRNLKLALDALVLLLLALPNVLASAPNLAYLAIFEQVAIFPIFYVCAVIGFSKVDRETLDAVRLQGLGLCGSFWRIFFPAARGWILCGLGVAFLRQALNILVLKPIF